MCMDIDEPRCEQVGGHPFLLLTALDSTQVSVYVSDGVPQYSHKVGTLNQAPSRENNPLSPDSQCGHFDLNEPIAL